MSKLVQMELVQECFSGVAEKEESLIIPELQTVRKAEQGTPRGYHVEPENEANTQEVETGKKRDTHIKP